MNKRHLHELNAGSWEQLSPRYRILHWYEMTSLTLHLKNSLVGWLQPKCKDTVTLTRLWIPAISKEDDIEDMTYVFLKPWLSFFRILYYFMYFGVIFPVKIVVFYKLPGEKIETWVIFCKNKSCHEVSSISISQDNCCRSDDVCKLQKLDCFCHDTIPLRRLALWMSYTKSVIIFRPRLKPR